MKHQEIEHIMGFIGDSSGEAVDARGMEVAASCFMAGEAIADDGVSRGFQRKIKNAWSTLCLLNPAWAREISFELLQAEVHMAPHVESTKK